MTAAALEIVPETPRLPRPPGFLLAPFGWATERVIVLLQRQPPCLPT
jgi:hypothetical protein